MISHSMCRLMVRDRRPPTPPTSICSSRSISEATAHPCFFLISSASCMGVRNPIAISLVRWSPPTASTAVCQMLPSSKTAMSDVPPPISTMTTPRSFSSELRVEREEASCWSTMSWTSSPARLQHLMMFWAEVTAPVTMWTSDSSRTPVIPSGSLIPPWPSTMNSWGRTWITSRSTGRATALAASMTLSTSFGVISRLLLETAMTPRLLIPLMWPPAIPTKTEWTSTPAMSSASSRARLMESTVTSMLITTPFRSPLEGLVPTPMMSRPPSSSSSAMMAQILVVPMSNPTITLLSRGTSHPPFSGGFRITRPGNLRSAYAKLCSRSSR